MSVISEAIKLIDLDQIFDDARENSPRCHLCAHFERYDDEDCGECSNEEAEQCPAVLEAIDKLCSAKGLAEVIQKGLVA